MYPYATTATASNDRGSPEASSWHAPGSTEDLRGQTRGLLQLDLCCGPHGRSGGHAHRYQQPARILFRWSDTAADTMVQARLPACEMCYAAAVPACEMCFAEVRLTPWVSAAHTSYH